MALVITNTTISENDGSVRLVTWAGLTEADTNPPSIEMVEWGDRSVQVTGTFNTGTVVLEGSNDGINWVILSDPQGTAISKTAAFIEQVLELTRHTRPRVPSGTGVTLTVTMVLRRGSSMRT